MVTLNNLVDMVIAQVSGGIVTDESKFTNEHVQLLIHQARSDLIASMKVKSYADILYQRYYPTYTESEQIDPCLVEFRLPDYINMNSRGDGIRYVGNSNEMEPFARLGKGTQKAVYAAHRVTNPYNRKDTMYAVALDPTGYMKLQLYNNPEIESFVVIGMLANPTDATYFRSDTDIYPVSAEMINVIIDIVTQKMGQMAATPADMVSNSADTPTQQGTPVPTNNRRRR